MVSKKNKALEEGRIGGRGGGESPCSILEVLRKTLSEKRNIEVRDARAGNA